MQQLIQPAPERLSIEQQFRLIEIAHTTQDNEIKRHALRLLYFPAPVLGITGLQQQAQCGNLG